MRQGSVTADMEVTCRWGLTNRRVARGRDEDVPR